MTDSLAQAQQLRTQALFAVHDANRSFAEKGWNDPVYVAGRTALDKVLIELAQAKWMLGRADGTHREFTPPASNVQAAAQEATRGFERSIAACEGIRQACEAGRAPEPGQAPELKRQAEILVAGATPLVPTVCPVVVLQGNNAEMGRQYAQQVIEIYGSWIFAQQASRIFTDTEALEISRWEAELQRLTPDVLEFAAGMAEGCTRAGLRMSRQQAVAIWTGIRPPAQEARPMAFAQMDNDSDARIAAAYLGVAATTLATESDMCSGICAWGRATADGSLIAGSSTDHDCTFQATIIAFPDQGYPFIYTPFSANGSIPVLGNFHMAGHPGMNAAGVAYVHHGGANTGEPQAQWGYGVRRGPATFHLLQFSTDAADARARLQAFPVGDAGISLGTVGGLFADAQQGFSVESRPGAPHSAHPIVREHSLDAMGKTYDFLYANNNAMAPESSHLNCPPESGYRYTVAGGWFTLDWNAIHAEPGPKAFRRLNTRSSEGRNRYAYRKMMEGYGNIDLEYMKAVYRQSGEMPAGTLQQIQRLWQSGMPWNSSTAHRGNAFTAVMQPRRGEGGRYLGCVGPAHRAVHARGPEHGYHYFDETNTFSEIELRRSPEAVLEAALDLAHDRLERSRAALSTLPASHPAFACFSNWLDEAAHTLQGIAVSHATEPGTARHQQLARIAKSLRSAVRSHVRSTQVIEAVASLAPAH